MSALKGCGVNYISAEESLSHLLLAGCDIGVHISASTSVGSSVQSHVNNFHLSTLFSISASFECKSLHISCLSILIQHALWPNDVELHSRFIDYDISQRYKVHKNFET